MESYNTSTFLGVAIASSVLTLCGSASASTTDYRDNTYIGGEFRLTSVTGLNGNEDGAIIAGVAGFETFCLERNELLAFRSTYGTLISDTAVFGGDSGPADALDVGHQHQDVPVLVPLPPAGWAGLASLGGLMCLGYMRRRRLQRQG